MIFNIIPTLCLRTLITLHNLTRSYRLRKHIKKIINHKRINLRYRGVKLNLGLDSSIESQIIFNEYEEKIILELITNAVQQNFFFIDIGANIGIHTLIAANANRYTPVYSFEPVRSNWLNFQRNISLNKFDNIKSHKIALGSREGTAEINIYPGSNKGRHSMKISFGKGKLKEIVSIQTLDYFIDNFRTNDIILKIDVEGYEMEVLQGAKQVLNLGTNKIVIIELLEEINSIQTCQEIANNLISKGFYCFKVNTRGLMKVSFFDGSGNYIFLQGKKAQRIFKTFLSR